jgi:AraC-like DNA-binding protein
MLTPHPTLQGLSLFTSSLDLHQHERHSHDCLSVIMITEGRKSYSLENQRMDVHRGQIAIANPGEVHGCKYVGGEAWSHRTWYVDQHLLQGIADEFELRQPALIVKPLLDMQPAHARLVRAHIASQSGDALDRESHALGALTYLFDQFGREKPSFMDRQSAMQVQARVQRLKDYIRAHLAQPLSLKALAIEAGVGRHQVMRDFQAIARMSPGDYLRQVRLLLAKQLIAQGVPLVDVAIQCGFTDQSHFSRTFRKVYGFTPREYDIFTRQRLWTVGL